MNNIVHSFSAAAVAVVAAFVVTASELSHPFLFYPYIGLTLIGSVLPDAIEPATSWQHRAKWHSQRCLEVMLILLIVGWAVGMLTGFFCVMFFALGYVIHLIEDATTPVGLPRR